MGINTAFIAAQVQGAVAQFGQQLQTFMLVEIVTIVDVHKGRCTCLSPRKIDGAAVKYTDVEIIMSNGPYAWNLDNSLGVLLVPRTPIGNLTEYNVDENLPPYSILGAKVIPVTTFQIPTVQVGYSGETYSIQANGVSLAFTETAITISHGAAITTYNNDGSVSVCNGATRILYSPDGTVTKEHVTEEDIPIWDVVTAPDGTITTTYYKEGADDRDSLEVAATRVNNVDGSSEFTIIGDDEDNPAWHVTIDATGKFELGMGENIALSVDMETPTISVAAKDVTVSIDGDSPVIEAAAKDVKVTLDGSGPAFTVTDGSNTVDASSSGMNLEDANGNKIAMGSSGMNLEDANGNKIAMGASGVDINGNFTVSS